MMMHRFLLLYLPEHQPTSISQNAFLTTPKNGHVLITFGCGLYVWVERKITIVSEGVEREFLPLSPPCVTAKCQCKQEVTPGFGPKLEIFIGRTLSTTAQ